MRNVKVFLPILLVAGVLAGCGGGGSSSAKLQSDDVVVVGSQHVQKTSFDQLIDQAKRSYQQQGQKFPKQGTTGYESVKSQVMTVLVQQAERAAKADSMGIKVTDADVTKRLDQIKKQYFGGSEKTYKAQLKKQHLTDQQVRDDIRAQLISEDIFNQVTKDVKVTQGEIDAYYKNHKSQYAQPATRDVRYILVGKDKSTAQSVYRQLQSGGDKAWCTLAKKYAKDSSGQNCGKATFSKGQTVAAFDKIAFSAPAHKVHAPFYDPTQYKSWFVVEPLGPVKPASTTPEKQVSSTIQQQLLQQKKNQVASKWASGVTKEFCSGSKITYQAGFAPSPDPCASAASTTTTQ
jgi:uncharacterized protein YeaC (DUF1315 family)